MYETFFGLSERPFAAVAEVDRYFPAASIEQARVTLTRCIERGEGPGLIIGPPGAGKTLLLHVLQQQFAPHYETVVLTAGHVGGRRGLLQSILHARRQPYRGLDDSELRLALVGRLIEARQNCEGLLLLVDEAHCALDLLARRAANAHQRHLGRRRLRGSCWPAALLLKSFSRARSWMALASGWRPDVI